MFLSAAVISSFHGCNLHIFSAGFLSGIMNTFGAIAGCGFPLTVGYLLSEEVYFFLYYSLQSLKI